MNAALRCGVWGLPAAEAALVRTLLRLYQHGASDFRWVLVDAPPYDALLVDSTLAGLPPIDGLTPMTAVLTLGPASLAGRADTLVRPLRSELLEAWLLQTQGALVAGKRPASTVQTPPGAVSKLADIPRAVAPMAAAAPFAPMPTVAAFAPTAPAELTALVAPAAVQAQPIAPAALAAEHAPAAPATPAAPRTEPAAHVATPAELQAVDTTLYKLLRWPPAAMLRNDPTQIRMATVLSRRAMKIGELAHLAQQPVDTAYAFVASMRGAGLLTTPTAAAAKPAALRDPRREVMPAPRRTHIPQKPERSLMSRIRSRLGL